MNPSKPLLGARRFPNPGVTLVGGSLVMTESRPAGSSTDPQDDERGAQQGATSVTQPEGATGAATQRLGDVEPRGSDAFRAVQDLVAMLSEMLARANAPGDRPASVDQQSGAVRGRELSPNERPP